MLKLAALTLLFLLSHLNVSNASLLALEKLYHIQEESLVSYCGIKYPPIPFGYHLERKN